MKKPAFTLAELLVALLIIAVILTLLAPVLTKRGKQALTIGKKNYQYKLYTYDKTNPECEEIAGVDNSLKCNFTVPAQVSLINAIAVSGAGGGAGGYWYNNSNPLVGDGAQGQMGYVYLYW